MAKVIYQSNRNCRLYTIMRLYSRIMKGPSGAPCMNLWCIGHRKRWPQSWIELNFEHWFSPCIQPKLSAIVNELLVQPTLSLSALAEKGYGSRGLRIFFRNPDPFQTWIQSKNHVLFNSRELWSDLKLFYPHYSSLKFKSIFPKSSKKRVVEKKRGTQNEEKSREHFFGKVFLIMSRSASLLSNEEWNEMARRCQNILLLISLPRPILFRIRSYVTASFSLAQFHPPSFSRDISISAPIFCDAANSKV